MFRAIAPQHHRTLLIPSSEAIHSSGHRQDCGPLLAGGWGVSEEGAGEVAGGSRASAALPGQVAISRRAQLLLLLLHRRFLFTGDNSAHQDVYMLVLAVNRKL